MRVNLLGQTNKKSHLAVNWMRIVSIILICSLLGVTGFIYWSRTVEVKTMKDEIDVLDRRLEGYSSREEKYYELKDELEEKGDIEIKEVIQYPWGESLLQVGYLIPENIKLESLRLEENTFIFEGIARSEQEVINFLTNLAQAPLFSAVDLIDIDKNDEITFSIEASIETGG